MNQPMRIRILLCLAVSVKLACAQPVASGTTPFILDRNRMYEHVEFIRPVGTARATLLFVDPGSPAMIFSADLLKELRSEKGIKLRVGRMDVAVDAGGVSSESWLPFSIGGNRQVEGLLPAGVMQKYQVRYDYSRRTITLALPR